MTHPSPADSLAINPPRATRARNVLLMLALMLTLLGVGYHVFLTLRAGGWWRDEVNSVNIATLPRLRDAWINNQYDSFPILWFIVLRAWHAVGFAATDAGWRVLGLIVGLLILALAWLNALRMKYAGPLLVIVLVALNPEVVRWASSMRAYGLGLALLLVMFGCFAKLIERVTWPRVLAATVAGLLAVQCIYYNSVMLFAIASGAAVAFAVRKRWRDAGISLATGIPAAVSILPYLRTVREINEWNATVKIHYTFHQFWMKLAEVLAAPGQFMLLIWAAVIVLAIIIGVRSQRAAARSLSPVQRDLSLFALATLGIGIPAYIAFLFRLSYSTEPWYYLALITLVAMCAEAILMPFIRPRQVTIAAIVIALVAAGGVANTVDSLNRRQTNVDVSAQVLAREADKEDLILVYPWFVGITFNRYYTGETPWMTIPRIDFLAYHRFDVDMQAMKDPEGAIEPVLEAIGRTLENGHAVWLVGAFPEVRPNIVAQPIPPAPSKEYGWYDGAYNWRWGMRASWFLRAHARHMTPLPQSPKAYVNEDFQVYRFSGWKEQAP
jgi:hypothetical protein